MKRSARTREKRRTALLAALAVTHGLAASAAIPAPSAYGPWGLDLTARDATVRPGDDFDRYANGDWRDRTIIPADRSVAGPIEDLHRLSEARVKAIILASRPGSPIHALYRAYMDERGIDARGAAPLAAVLRPVTLAPDRDELFLALARPGLGGPPVSLGVELDPDDVDRYVFGFEQGGLTLPDRDDYLLDRFAPQRAELERYVERVLARTGDARAAAHAEAVVGFETAVARVSYSRSDAQDLTKSVNPMTLGAWAAIAPGVPWSRFAAVRRLPDGAGQRVIVGEKDALIGIARLWGTTPLDTLKAWATFRIADAAAPYLPHRFADDATAFHDGLRGVHVVPPRDQQAVDLVNDRLGDLVGQAYVARFSEPGRKAAITDLVANVEAAVERRLAANTWLSPSSRKAALAKLKRLQVQVEYPEAWRSYAGLRLSPDDLLGDMERLEDADWAWRLNLFGRRLDRRLWAMTPQTPNAYNAGQELKIVFPAGRLQSPFFAPAADPAVNYGAIGAIIGHEISHTFDDQGRHINEDGALKDWWTGKDVSGFERRTKALGEQYDDYEPLPGAQVDGRLTMNENIADLVGLSAALDAYHASLHGEPAPVRDGLTGDQRFFLAYAQSKREKRRDADVRARLSNDEHAPAQFRIDGVVRNIDDWYGAFSVRPGDRYYLPPQQRVRIW